MPITTENYEFTKLELDKDEFHELIFMGPPPIWEKNPQEHRFLRSLCFKPLKDVVELVMEETCKEKTSAESVFDGLLHIKAKNESAPWFEKHKIISHAFDKRLMDRLWIRNITKGGKEKESGGKFYMQDGNHRALVYAIVLKCAGSSYEKVNALHATSWDIAQGILGYSIQSAHELENNGIFNQGGRYEISGFDAPITLYERITP